MEYDRDQLAKRPKLELIFSDNTLTHSFRVILFGLNLTVVLYTKHYLELRGQ